MSINLSKGGRVDLTKTNPGVSKFRIGLGWDTNATVGGDYDLDVSAFILGENGKLISEENFVFYNNLKSPTEFLVHTGDNRTGVGDGDDESLVLDVSKAAGTEKTVVFVVTIHEAATRSQNFGQVNNSFIRVLDEAKYQAASSMPSGTQAESDAQDKALKDAEILRYDLGEDYSTETALIFGEVYKNEGEWKFKATGSGMNGGLQDFVDLYQ